MKHVRVVQCERCRVAKDRSGTRAQVGHRALELQRHKQSRTTDREAAVPSRARRSRPRPAAAAQATKTSTRNRQCNVRHKQGGARRSTAPPEPRARTAEFSMKLECSELNEPPLSIFATPPCCGHNSTRHGRRVSTSRSAHASPPAAAMLRARPAQATGLTS